MRRTLLLFWIMMFMSVSGCATYQNLKEKNTSHAEQVQKLEKEISELNQELAGLKKSKADLIEAKDGLEKKLKEELSSGDLLLTFEEKGLVITFLDRILFASGQAELKSTAQSTLEKVAETLREVVPEKRIYVEGHTDNVPIQRSGWKSNWELSAMRATGVVHFLEKQGIISSRLVASGYGEFNPVADNQNPEGRRKNRRVEIIVSPKSIRDLLPQKNLEPKA